MEAVGQLAGGVAHDFNNLLSVILSYATFVGEVVQDAQARADVEEITKAATRAAGLTRQLLAFSRKQVLEPQVLELNRLASDLEKMLRRLIGEDVELVQRFASELGRVKADPGQLEQVIMNLVVNARDAMPEGGTLTIETANLQSDDEYVTSNVTLQPGAYVVLTVSDTGSGMDETTQQRLFEPFFTTKEVGKGTGLGLSTVYGIVKQSGGSIGFDSQLGIGTVFRVYLPRVKEATSVAPPPAEARSSHGTETILVVEDDQAVRNIAARVLRGAGYQVLTAKDGQEALLVLETKANDIDLVLTDVVMPQMSGKQLAERLFAMRPDMPVVFMSGYTDNMIERHGVLEPGTLLISKPFSAGELGTKVRAALDAPRRVGADAQHNA
jgi:CheY-like chemotaxis protein